MSEERVKPYQVTVVWECTRCSEQIKESMNLLDLYGERPAGCMKCGSKVELSHCIVEWDEARAEG